MPLLATNLSGVMAFAGAGNGGDQAVTGAALVGRRIRVFFWVEEQQAAAEAQPPLAVHVQPNEAPSSVAPSSQAPSQQDATRPAGAAAEALPAGRALSGNGPAGQPPEDAPGGGVPMEKAPAWGAPAEQLRDMPGGAQHSGQAPPVGAPSERLPMAAPAQEAAVEQPTAEQLPGGTPVGQAGPSQQAHTEEPGAEQLPKGLPAEEAQLRGQAAAGAAAEQGGAWFCGVVTTFLPEKVGCW